MACQLYQWSPGHIANCYGAMWLIDIKIPSMYNPSNGQILHIVWGVCKEDWHKSKRSPMYRKEGNGKLSYSFCFEGFIFEHKDKTEFMELLVIVACWLVNNKIHYHIQVDNRFNSLPIPTKGNNATTTASIQVTNPKEPTRYMQNHPHIHSKTGIHISIQKQTCHNAHATVQDNPVFKFKWIHNPIHQIAWMWKASIVLGLHPNLER